MNRLNRFLLLSLICHGLGLASFSQQGNTWYFGRKAGLDFNTTPPTSLTNGAMSTDEGCAVVSDFNGQLLFYTDGSTVYNRNHQPMPNGTGLLGHSSASNSAIIIPKPGSTTNYYIFTADAAERQSLNGYNYSEVDISLDGGLGDVTTKNTRLFAPSTERLTAARHANGVDVWVITKMFANNTWQVYRVDCSGVQPTPVVSNAGFISQTVGCMKVSPDGKKLAITEAAGKWWEVCDFDNATGQITNAKLQELDWTYGVEFSPDSKLIYLSQEIQGKVYQYDITNFDSLAILSSRALIGALNIPNRTNNFIGGLQLGPDGKIYCATNTQTDLAVINSPNSPGTNCNYVNAQVQLVSGTVRRTLPVFFNDLITSRNANFTFSGTATCGVVNFSASAAIPGPLSFDWDFGDGVTGTGQNITHTYATGGPTVFDVQLTITVPGVCAGIVIKRKLDLNPAAPVANFGFTDTCGRLIVDFTDSSKTLSDLGINIWKWDFGDGNTATGQHPSHTYGMYGTYTVTLDVSVCTGGSSGNIQKTFVVKPKPMADFTNTNTCVNTVVDFRDASTSLPLGAVTKWFYDFGDGTTATTKDLQKTYNRAGNFMVKYATTSSDGCTSDTIRRTLAVNTVPKSGFSMPPGCATQQVQFRDQSTITSGTIRRIYWDFGNGVIMNNNVPNPATTYPTEGNYIVKQVVESASGCLSDTTTQTLKVEARPVADMTLEDACEGAVTAFRDRSTTTASPVTKWSWLFGNGDKSDKQQPDYRYPAGGNYMVKLAVASQIGCLSDTVTKPVYIESRPRVAFEFDKTCVGEDIDFINRSAIDVGNIVKWRWDFANGDISTDENTSYRYSVYGDYNVSLTAVSTMGCSASAARLVRIAKIDVRAGEDTIAAIGQPVQLRATGAKNYSWSPGFYLNNTAIADPVSTPSQNVTYFLAGETAEGCWGFDTMSIKVYKGPEVYVPNAFAPEGNNKIFRPILAGISKLFDFSVYNRWGQLVYQTNQPGKGWDGRVAGTMQPSGTFVWTLKAVDYLGKVVEKRGTVLLLR